VDGNGRLEGIVTEGDFLHHLDAGDLSEFKSARRSCRATSSPSTSRHARDAIGLMSRNRYSCVVVMREQIPYGILTERDVVKLATKRDDLGAIPIAEVVRTPLITIPPNMPLPDAIRHMDQHRIRHLVITENDRLLGLVTRHDLVKTLQGSYVNFLHETILGSARNCSSSSSSAACSSCTMPRWRRRPRDRHRRPACDRPVGQPAFSRLTGYSLEETVGSHIRDLVQSGAQGPDFYGHLWKTILSGQVWHGEIINRRKNGSLYPEEMTITPVCIEGNEISHFIAVKHDISERKQTESQLREAAR